MTDTIGVSTVNMLTWITWVFCLWILTCSVGVSASCPYGWKDYPGSESCYLVTDYQVRYSFDLAVDKCRSHESELIKINSKPELEWFIKEIRMLSSTYIPPKMAWWVGLLDEGQGKGIRYLDGSSVDLLDMFPWPNNTVPAATSSRKCASSVNSTMTLSECGSWLGLMCERSKALPLSCDVENEWVYINGSCFKFFTDLESWSEARSTCKKYDSDLAILETVEEMAFVWDKAKMLSFSTWVGFKSDLQTKQYLWVDGSPLKSDLTWWYEKQPVDLSKQTDQSPDYCGLVKGNNTYRLSSLMTTNCTTLSYFTCSKPQGVCAEGWIPHQAVCFKFYPQYQLSWSSAQKYCRDMGAELLTIPWKSHQTAVNQYLKEVEIAGAQSLWIGLRDGQWADPMATGNWSNWATSTRVPGTSYGYIVTGDVFGQWQQTTDASSRRSFACAISGSKLVKDVPPPTASFQCEPGWQDLGDSCVYLGDEDVGWYIAQKKCQGMSAQLAVITSADTQAYLNSIVSNGGRYWIGLHDRQKEGNFTWVNGTVLNFTNWEADEPDNKDNENCVFVRGTSDGAKWDDLACSEINGYICQKEPLNKNGSTPRPPPPTSAPYSPLCGTMWEQRPGTNICYQFRDTQLSWPDALDVCKQYNGSLVSITSSEERSFIEARLASFTSLSVWIGLSDARLEASWTWEDNSPLALLNWSPGEPNDIHDEDCASISLSNMLWYDYDCSHRSGFICKKMGDSGMTTTPMTTTPVSVPAGKFYGCAQGWISYNNNCYKARQTSVTWNEAETICRQEGANLASINSPNENDFIWSQLPRVSELCKNLHSNDSQCDGWAKSGECYRNPTWMSAHCRQACAFCNQSCMDTRTHMECTRWAKRGECTTNSQWMWDHCTLSCGCNKTMNEGFWVGLNDHHKPLTFTWTDYSPVTFTNWMLNEPGNFAGQQENCVKIHLLTGAWSNEPCDRSSQGYLCKKPMSILDSIPAAPPSGCPAQWFGYQSWCYLISDTARTWENARASCQAAGGYLATLTDSVVTAYITSDLVGKTSSYWVGLYSRDSTYKWDRQASVDYLPWVPEHTGNRNNSCVALRSQRPIGLIEDDDCQKTQPYICERLRTGYTLPTSTTVPVTTTPAPCPDSWYGLSDHCYMLAKDRKPWKEAQLYCEQFGGNLASIHSQDAADFVSRLNGAVSVSDGYWIGLSDLNKESSFQWSDGSPFDYSYWAPHEPNNATAAEDCIMVISSVWNRGKWNDYNCYVAKQFVCEIARGVPFPSIPTAVSTTPNPACEDPGWVYHNGFCYYTSPATGSDSSLTWFESRRKCLSMSGDLVSIASEDENNFLISVVSLVNRQAFWLGFNQLDQDSYVWSDGTPPIYTAWKQNEPNDAYGGQRCVSFDSQGVPGTWVDDNCMDDKGYVCKKLNSSVTPKIIPPTPIIQGVCPSGFLSEGVTNKCYYVGGRGSANDPKLSWTQARTACRQMSGDQRVDIGSISSVIDQDFVTLLLEQLDTDLWIGLSNYRKYNMWTWQDDSEVTYTNWASGKPSYHYSPGFCVKMLRDPNKAEDAAKWEDATCGTARPYLCQTIKTPLASTSATSTTSQPVSSTSLCPPHFFRFRNTCYSAINQPKTWADAWEACKFFKGDLASTLDVFEVSRLDLAMYNTHIGQPAWIGMRFDMGRDQYVWTDQWPVDNVFWGVGDPDLQTNNSCVTLFKASWNDTSCDEKLPYICEVKSELPPTPTPTPEGHCADMSHYLYGDFCYLVDVNDRASWPEAAFKCGQMGMNLVSIHSEEENKFLTNLVISTTPSYLFLTTNIWIGLRRGTEGSFRWTDGSENNYYHWENGEPSSVLQSNFDDEECVEMYYDKGTWNDVPCMQKSMGYICKVRKIVPTSTTTTTTTIASTTTSKSSVTQPDTTASNVPVRSEVTGSPQHMGSRDGPEGNASSLTGGQIAGIVIGIIGFVIIVGTIAYVIRLKYKPAKPHLFSGEDSSVDPGFNNALYVHASQSQPGEDGMKVTLGIS